MFNRRDDRGGPRPPNQGQQQRGQQQGRQQRGGQQQQRRPQRDQQRQQQPPPPPSYFQRDLLLVPDPASAAALQEVRARFDPLAQKVPPHITLLEPEPKAKIQNDYLKKLSLDALPKLSELRFEKVIVQSSVYLWLMPSSEGAERLRAWREAVVQALPQPVPAGEEFVPHITLGYLSRDLSADETLQMIREKLKLPATLVFSKLLLEEFGDNQISVPIDSWPL